MGGPNFLNAGPLEINSDLASYFLNGKVGIGTTNPASKLSVHGTNPFTEPYAATVFVGRRPDAAVASLGIGYDATHVWFQNVDGGGNLNFFNYDGSWHQRIQVTPGGAINVMGRLVIDSGGYALYG